jgi:cephalosporin-C deacetylase-like acetyl esterase
MPLFFGAIHDGAHMTRVRRSAVACRLAAGAAACAALAAPVASGADAAPPADAFRVLEPAAEGPAVTPYLRLQLERAWAFDEMRRSRLDAIRSEAELHSLEAELRRALLASIGGLPAERGRLNARIVDTIPRSGYRVEKLVFESLPGLHVTAHVYVPEGAPQRRPAVLLACGHSPIGKAHPAYQEIAARLALRGYVVLCWDPIGQGERSQFWDASRERSRFNLVCGEHAILGNLATLAGLGIGRYFVWDGMRALDYLLTRPDVDGTRVSITGNSGGGFQSAWLAALDERIRVAAPSCFLTSLPMRMANRIFEDPDSDPEQDPPGFVSEGVDHAGLLALAFPKPVHLAAAVLDFFPIEGTRKTVREIAGLYGRFGYADRLAASEGYHKHGYSPENQEAAFAFLDRRNGLPVRRGLAKVETLSEEASRCTASGQVRVDLPGRSLVDVIREHAAARRAPGWSAATLYRAGGAPDVRRLRVVAHDPSRSQPDAIAWETAGSVVHEDAAIDRYRLHHSGRLVLPLVHVRRKSGASPRAVIDVGLTGKLGPGDWGAALEHLRAGRDVLSFDARGLGETRMRYRTTPPAAARAETDDDAYADVLSSVLANYVYNAQLLGRPYVLEMVEDVEIVARFARERLGARGLALAGRGEARVVAALAADLLPDLEPLTGRDLGWWSRTLEEGREVWPIQLLLPGGALLQPSSSGR